MDMYLTMGSVPCHIRWKVFDVFLLEGGGRDVKEDTEISMSQELWDIDLEAA
jgi:hypothetical protein